MEYDVDPALQTQGAQPAARTYFADDHYLIRRKIMKLLGGAFHIFNLAGEIVGYTQMKAFKLKEDLTMYESEDMQRPIFTIKARHVIDLAATYDVTDSATGRRLGAFRRKALKSILKDEWRVLDPSDNEIGKITEDSMLMASLRRFLTNLIPQAYECTVNGALACRYKQDFNPFVMKINVDFGPDTGIDRNLLMAGGILLCAIEGHQD